MNTLAQHLQSLADTAADLANTVEALDLPPAVAAMAEAEASILAGRLAGLEEMLAAVGPLEALAAESAA